MMQNKKIPTYPRYTRDQKVNTKITISDIAIIKNLFARGMDRNNIAKLFKVCWHTVNVVLMTPEEQKLYYKRKVKYNKPLTLKISRKYKKRKLDIFRDRYKSWLRFSRFIGDYKRMKTKGIRNCSRSDLFQFVRV